MPLLTYKESKKIKEQSPVKKIVAALKKDSKKKEDIIFGKARSYFNNELSGDRVYPFFDNTLKKEICFLCKNGVVHTKNKSLAGYLESHGFRFLKELDEEEFDDEEDFLEYMDEDQAEEYCKKMEELN